MTPGKSCSTRGKDYTEDECKGGLKDKVLREVRTALDSDPKTAGARLAPEVTQADLDGYLPRCFILGDIAGYRVYWNTGAGSEPPTVNSNPKTAGAIQRGLCKP